MPYAQGTPSWVELETADPEVAEAFYGTLFGWRFDETRLDVGEPGYAVATLGDAVVAGIAPRAATPTTPASWATYLAVDDVDRSAKAVAEAGGTVVAGPVDVAAAGRGAVVLDPTGAAFGLWQAGLHEGVEVTGAPGTMCRNELRTSDPAAAAAFYREVLGAEPQLAAAPGEASQWHVYFGVAPDRIDALVRVAHELGATVLAGPADTATGPTALLLDPQGARFSLWAPVAESQ